MVEKAEWFGPEQKVAPLQHNAVVGAKTNQHLVISHIIIHLCDEIGNDIVAILTHRFSVN